MTHVNAWHTALHYAWYLLQTTDCQLELSYIISLLVACLLVYNGELSIDIELRNCCWKSRFYPMIRNKRHKSNHLKGWREKTNLLFFPVVLQQWLDLSNFRVDDGGEVYKLPEMHVAHTPQMWGLSLLRRHFTWRSLRNKKLDPESHLVLGVVDQQCFQIYLSCFNLSRAVGGGSPFPGPDVHLGLASNVRPHFLRVHGMVLQISFVGESLSAVGASGRHL